MTERRIGVYICYCGGNISDYVNCERVREAVQNEEGVAVARTAMFTCSDATQQEIIDDIKEQKLDGLVVASCSPTLHQMTFREVAKRAGLNPYQYTQVNLREQCSWAHTDSKEEANDKAIRLVKAGISSTLYTKALNDIRIKTVPRVLVIGAGITGLKTALALSDLGLTVYVIEKTKSIGGWLATFKEIYACAGNRKGDELVSELVEEIEQRENIIIHTHAELTEKSGSVGNFDVKISVNKESISLNVGSIIVCTGFESYQPESGEFSYGVDGVLTLPDFMELISKWEDKAEYKGKPVHTVAYIYCVGSRQESGDHAHSYCSRYCCNAAIHTSTLAQNIASGLHQFHFFRDIRTFGKYELLYEEARHKGAVFIKFNEENPPQISRMNGKFQIKATDILTQNEELELEVDLVILVTGMEPRKNESLLDILKIPVGLDGFYKEIHPKLRPVETVIDGVFVAGSSQAPRSAIGSAASGMAAAAKSASQLLKGYVELSPLIAEINADQCTWCGECLDACPYSAIEKTTVDGKDIATINEALCKGCGGCVPICSQNAIDVKGYTDQQVMTMIESMGEAL